MRIILTNHSIILELLYYYITSAEKLVDWHIDGTTNKNFCTVQTLKDIWEKCTSG